MLPATTVASPAARASAPVSAVTVVLPFDAGDREHLLRRRQRAREELDVADELRAARDGGGDRRLVLRDARADRDQVGARERRVGERARCQRERPAARPRAVGDSAASARVSATRTRRAVRARDGARARAR